MTLSYNLPYTVSTIYVASTSYFRWVTQGHNCPRCQAMDGSTMSAVEWELSIKPGFHFGCDCHLTLVAIDYTAITRIVPIHFPQGIWISDILNGKYGNTGAMMCMAPGLPGPVIGTPQWLHEMLYAPPEPYRVPEDPGKQTHWGTWNPQRPHPHPITW